MAINHTIYQYMKNENENDRLQFANNKNLIIDVDFSKLKWRNRIF